MRFRGRDPGPLLAHSLRFALVLALLQMRPAQGVMAADVLEPTDDLLARGIQAREHLVHGVEVLEIVLGKVDFDARLPLVMRIHGRHSDWQLPAGSYANIDEPYRLLVPRGVIARAGRRSWAVPSVRDGESERLRAEIEDSADRLVRVLAHFRANRRSVGTPIVTGFSQGGMVALAMGVRHPAAVGTVLPVAAHLVVGIDPARLARARLPEVHALHGEADEVVAPGPAERAREVLRESGFETTLRLFPDIRHQLTGEMARAHRALLERALERATREVSGFGA